MFIGNLAAQLIILFNMHVFALTCGTCQTEKNTLFTCQQQLDINIAFMQLRLFFLWRLRGELHHVHKQIVAFQYIVSRRVILHVCRQRKGQRIKQNRG
ncbi:hypothetical protein D3C81_1882110 [compost metagenome]